MIPNALKEEYEEYNFNNILNLYLKSLDRIEKLKPNIIFPAHQNIIYDSSKRILEIKEHHEKRLSEISNLIKEKPMTPFEISQVHFGTDLDEINSFMALSEILGHLFYLENLGKIDKFEKNGKFHYKS